MAFENFIDQGKPTSATKWRRVTYMFSLGLHAALLIVGAVYSFWHVEELSPPSVSVTPTIWSTGPPRSSSSSNKA